MLILKRLLASLINIFTFIIVTLLLYPLLNWLRIEVEPKYFLFLVFCLVFFIPIIKLKSTIGNKITKLHVNDFKKLLIKYLIYYFITSGGFKGYINIIKSIFNIDIFPNLSSGLLFIALLLTFLIMSLILFIISVGRYNLLDFILGVSHNQEHISRNIYLILSTWFISFYILSCIVIVIKKNSVYDFFESLLKPSNKISTSYFPTEVFDNYSVYQLVKYNWSSNILTFSDESSFFQDRYLQQKVILCLIKKSTFENPLKRYELCTQLFYYSQFDDIFNDNEVNPDQIKFVLIYNKPQTFFSVKTYIFKYFYDVRNSKHGIYGGVDLDSLAQEYNKHSSFSRYNKLLTCALGISIDSLHKRTNKSGKLNLSAKEDSLLRNFDFSSLTKNDYFLFTIKPFLSVKPDSLINIDYPFPSQYQISLTDNNYFDERLEKTIYLRNFYFYHK